MIPSVSACWSLLLDPVMRLPECSGPRWAMLIKVFVEPEAQNTTSRLGASDLNTFAPPSFLTSQRQLVSESLVIEMKLLTLGRQKKLST